MNEDKIIQKLLEHDGKLERIEEKVQKVDMFDDVLKGQDKIIQLLTRIDQERVFTNTRMDRIEKERIVKLETDMKIVKQHLQLV